MYVPVTYSRHNSRIVARRMVDELTAKGITAHILPHQQKRWKTFIYIKSEVYHEFNDWKISTCNHSATFRDFEAIRRPNSGAVHTTEKQERIPTG